MNEIAHAPMAYTDLERLAASVAQSGLFGIRTKDQAIALMMIAHAEGRHPALAARDYDIIQGKPAKKAEAMMRDFIQAGGKVEWHELSDNRADATFTHPQTGSVRIDWDLERAKTAGLAGKDNWKKFPRSMLRSRVVSEGVRTIWPLATSGMYVPEEASDIPPEHTGPTVEHEALQVGQVALNQAGLQVGQMKAAAVTIPAEPENVTPSEENVTPLPDKVTPQKAAAAAMPAAPRKRQTIADWLEAHRIALNDCESREAVDEILESEEMQRARETFTNGAKTKLETMISKALERWYEQPTEEEAQGDDLEDIAALALP